MLLRRLQPVVGAIVVWGFVAAPSIASPPSRVGTLPQAVSPAVQQLHISGVDNDALGSLAPPSTASSAAGANRSLSSATAKPEVLSKQLSAAPFDLVGVVWSATSTPAGATVHVRVREGAAWTPWQKLELADGGPDPASPEGRNAAARAATEPLFVQSADAVQVQMETPDNAQPQQVRAVLVDPGDSASAESAVALAAAAPNSSGESVIPPIISRAAWGADERLRTCTPATNSSVDMAFVHHTVNANNYTAAQAPGLIRSMYAFHVQGRGFCDIGYNFLVDRFGRIFEGRAGGIRLGVVGAHTQGFNSLSVGVSMIGDFSSVTPTSQTLASVGRVVGWKLGMYERNPQGLTTVVSGGSNKFPAGTVVRLSVVSGHRDAALTACPGNTGYAHLPHIRQHAAHWASVENHSPFGRIDSVTEVNGGVRARGWAIDPDVTTPIQLVLTVDGRPHIVLANRSRPDIGAAFPRYGSAHGFDIALPAGAGRRVICATAVNTGIGASTPIGCVAAVVRNHNPVGHLDSAVAVTGGIRVTGWTLDPDTTASIYAWVDVSGIGQPVQANLSRPDVGRAYPEFGDRHGFSITIPKARGTYRVCAFGVNTGWGTTASIGCLGVTVR